MSDSSQESAVEFTNVSFSYADREVLSEINLSIPRGKIVAIMGGSGSGKTTLLRLIGRQVSPTQGSVKVNNLNLAELSRKELFLLRRKMGMLFQMGALFTDLSVFDNVAFPMREHSDLPETLIKKLVYMKLQAVGLRGAHNYMPAELSGGMARRVALARAVALDPQLILFDEPFAGLDPISLGIIGELIRTLNGALGATSIVVTHDIPESLKIVDYVYFIAEGSVIFHGSVDEVRASTHPFVYQFIRGEMNGPVPFHIPASDYRSMLLEPRS